MNEQLGCIAIPLAPGRREPSDKSEMITQLLFGEVYQVLEEQKKWILIRNEADQYECWIDRKQHSAISEKLNLGQTIRSTIAPLVSENQTWFLPAGSKVNHGMFSIGKRKFSFDGPNDPIKKDPILYANQLLGAPYLWGGKSILGIDCSGFVQVVYSCCGIQLPRDAYQQAEVGETVDFVETARAGDLAYFDNEEGRITHVGLMLDGEHIIHASGSVRIDRIDHEGIYNSETESYSHRLRIVKRVIQ
ncbi:C40 family peptidase [Cryomorphaceae bacterium 1068]|nr:C40 family peptidase [Cryomorphaceae bacterium 1068]